MAKRKKGNLESITKLLKGVYPAPDQLEAARAFAWWTRSVPPRIVENARPVRLSGGVLLVHELPLRLPDQRMDQRFQLGEAALDLHQRRRQPGARLTRHLG